MICGIVLANLFSCQNPQPKEPQALYNSYCSSCHIVPSVQDLPKSIWASEILPEMGARMGIRDSGYSPFKGYPFYEMEAVMKTNVYPIQPSIAKEDWEIIKNYVLANAPDSLVLPQSKVQLKKLADFKTSAFTIDNNKGSFTTYLSYNTDKNIIEIGDAYGYLRTFNFLSKQIEIEDQYPNSILDHAKIGEKRITTLVGKLDPSELASGRIWVQEGAKNEIIQDTLHRPIHNLVKDLNKNGIEELVVSEFGNFTGSLSLFILNAKGSYEKKVLLNQPGAIRVLAHDMDQNGLDDLIVLTSQGDESITILYQDSPLNFRIEKAIRFSPIYGSSWFELIDYDKDGDMDIITVHGDNADKSFVHKPYHGMRIHLNDGSNRFVERYFYPLFGATRVLARDFDQDDDIDIALISTFPDYENNPETSFVYLKNNEAAAFKFSAHTFDDVLKSKWFMMDAGDVDKDGDDDIILSSFTYSFNPVPKELSKKWAEEDIDLLILENQISTTPSHK